MRVESASDLHCSQICTALQRYPFIFPDTVLLIIWYVPCFQAIVVLASATEMQTSVQATRWGGACCEAVSRRHLQRWRARCPQGHDSWVTAAGASEWTAATKQASAAAGAGHNSRANPGQCQQRLQVRALNCISQWGIEPVSWSNIMDFSSIGP